MAWKLPASLSVVLIAALIVAACAPAVPTATPVPAKPAEAPKPAAPAAAPAAAPTNTAAPAAAAPAATKPAEPTKPAAAAAPATAAAPTKPAEAPKPAAPAAPKAGVTKLSFIGVQSDDQQFALTAILREYQKQRPDIDVEFELLPFAQLFPKIQANTAAKTPTDIVLADGPNVWSFAYNGIIAPMDEWFDQEYIRRNWTPTSLLTSQYRGKFFAPPQMESCSVMWFNKDLTDKAGVRPPQEMAESWTTTQALEAWQKVNAPPQVYGVRWGQGNTPGQDYEAGILRRIFGAKGSPAYQGLAQDGLTITGHFDHADAVKGHTFFHELYQKHKVSAVEGIPNAWFDQRAAFYISPDNAVGTYNRLGAKFAYGVTPLPKAESQLCHTDSWHYALGANSANKKEAAEFIKFLSGPVGSKIFYDRVGQLPSHAELLNTLPDYQQQPRKTVGEMFRMHGQPRIVTVGFTEYNALMQEFVGNMVSGQNLDIQQIATALARRSDSLTAKYKDWQTKP
jgi:fructooligosaccharide transport system substrate-binding protein